MESNFVTVSTVPLRKSLIDEFFPIAEVSEAAAREKSVRHGHISTLQQWWARRPNAVARAAIFLSLCPDAQIIANSIFESELRSMFPGLKSVKEQCYALSIVLAKFSERDKPDAYLIARQLLTLGRDSPPSVMDSFAGGGAFPIEALRLGLNTFAGDLNPVATTALRIAIELLPTMDAGIVSLFEKSAQRVQTIIQKNTRDIYLLDREDPLAYFWCLTYTCPSCNVEVPLLRDYWLAKKKKNVAVRLILNPDATRFDFEIFSPKNEDEKIAASTGNIDRGGATCPNCKFHVSTAWIRSQTQIEPLGERLYAKLLQGSERKYFIVCQEDEKIANVCKSSETVSDKDLEVPSELLDLNGIRHTWAMQYGVKATKDLYGHRQGIALLEVMAAISDEKNYLYHEHDEKTAKIVTLLLCLTFNRLISYGTKHSWWQSNGEFPANMFGRQAIPMVWNYVEMPVSSNGAAGWSSATSWIAKVANELRVLPRRGTIWTGDAKSIPLENGVIDLVAIDPPYYDTIAYAYLSDTYYVWMKQIIGEVLPDEFQDSVTPKLQEAIVDRSHTMAPSPKDAIHFYQKMVDAFTEARRVMKPDGRLITMYGHKKIEAWDAFMRALSDSGFSPIASWPIHTERKVKFKHNWVDALATSCLIVCVQSKFVERQKIDIKDFNELLKDILDVSIDRFRKVGIEGSDLTSALIAPAYQIWMRYIVISAGFEMESGEFIKLLPIIAKEREQSALQAENIFTNHQEISEIIYSLTLSTPLESNSRTSKSYEWTELVKNDPTAIAARDYCIALRHGLPSKADSIYESLSREDQQVFYKFLKLVANLSAERTVGHQIASAGLGRLQRIAP